jgi:hypothetical protein
MTMRPHSRTSLLLCAFTLASAACTNTSGEDTTSSSSSGSPASSSSAAASSSSGTPSSSRAASSSVGASSMVGPSSRPLPSSSSTGGSSSTSTGGSSFRMSSSSDNGSGGSVGGSTSSNGGSGSSVMAGSGSSSNGGSGSAGSSSSGGASSGGSSSGVVINTVLEYCNALGPALCTPPSCNYTGQVPVQADCLRGYQNGCPVFANMVEAQVDAGQRVFDPAAATTCVNTAFVNFNAQRELSCLDPANPNSTMLLYEGYFGTATCAGGLPTYQPGLFQASQNANSCDRITPGLVPGAGSCGEDDVCRSQECTNRPDGGCGSCAPETDGGATVDLPPANVDESCINRDDGGVELSRRGCVLGLACNDVSTRCEPYVGAGSACGTGVRGVCSGACGYRCTDTADGGRCNPAGAAGEPCDFNGAFCQEGLTCRPGRDDGGLPDFPNSTCGNYAAVNQPCSGGYTYEMYPRSLWTFTGGISFGIFPNCAPGLRCNIAEGQSDGTCVTVTGAATGQACTNDSAFPCLTRGDRCITGTDGGFCQPRGGNGDPCTSNEDCGVNLFCAQNGGASQCEFLRPEGAPCATDGDCAGTAACVEHACLLLEHLTGGLAPLCR